MIQMLIYVRFYRSPTLPARAASSSVPVVADAPRVSRFKGILEYGDVDVSLAVRLASGESPLH